jgi:hypothetical protein
MGARHAMLRTATEDDMAAERLRTVASALAWTRAVRHLDDDTACQRADDQLAAAVSAARDAGLTWGTIANVLGVARGNAYQRYRHRPPQAPWHHQTQ